MTGQLIGSLILWLIVAVIVIAIVVYLVNWLYRRSSKEFSFVRTGLFGEKVVINGGAFVLPIIHDVTPVNMNVLQLAVTRANNDALITRDRMRVDIDAEFYVRVKPERQSVSVAAATLGRRELVELLLPVTTPDVGAKWTAEALHARHYSAEAAAAAAGEAEERVTARRRRARASHACARRLPVGRRARPRGGGLGARCSCGTTGCSRPSASWPRCRRRSDRQRSGASGRACAACAPASPGRCLVLPSWRCSGRPRSPSLGSRSGRCSGS